MNYTDHNTLEIRESDANLPFVQLSAVWILREILNKLHDDVSKEREPKYYKTIDFQKLKRERDEICRYGIESFDFYRFKRYLMSFNVDFDLLDLPPSMRETLYLFFVQNKSAGEVISEVLYKTYKRKYYILDREIQKLIDKEIFNTYKRILYNEFDSFLMKLVKFINKVKKLCESLTETEKGYVVTPLLLWKKHILSWLRDMKKYLRFRDLLQNIRLIASTERDVFNMIFNGAYFDNVALELIPLANVLREIKTRIESVENEKDILKILVTVEQHNFDSKALIPIFLEKGFSYETMVALYERAKKIAKFDINDMVVDKARDCDVKAIYEIYQMYPTLLNQLSKQQIQNLVYSNKLVYVARYNGDVIGVIRLDYGRSEFCGLAVHPDYLGKGVAKLLLQKAKEVFKEHFAKCVTVWVKKCNKFAKEWWLRRGFKSFDDRLLYYDLESENDYDIVERLRKVDIAKLEKLVSLLEDYYYDIRPLVYESRDVDLARHLVYALEIEKDRLNAEVRNYKYYKRKMLMLKEQIDQFLNGEIELSRGDFLKAVRDYLMFAMDLKNTIRNLEWYFNGDYFTYSGDKPIVLLARLAALIEDKDKQKEFVERVREAKKLFNQILRGD